MRHPTLASVSLIALAIAGNGPVLQARPAVEVLHRFAGGLSPTEVRSAVSLGLITFVVYPILPNEFIDRWKVVNPRETWTTVVLIAGIGFFNYVLLRLDSAKGLTTRRFLVDWSIAQ